MSEAEPTSDVAALTVQLLSAYLANNTVASDNLAGLIRSTREALTQGIDTLGQGEPETFTPAVSVRKSLASPDHIISLIDGKPYKTLKRHLMGHGLTPEAYRSRYNLPANYPMVAPAYGEHRRNIAKEAGLGIRKPAVEETPIAQPEEPSDANIEDAGESEPQAAIESLASDPTPSTRKAKATPAKSPKSEAGKSKRNVAIKPAPSSQTTSKEPSNAADKLAVQTTVTKPKRRAKLGLFEKVAFQPIEPVNGSATQIAESSSARQEPASDDARNSAKEPPKRKSPNRMARTPNSQGDEASNEDGAAG